MPKPRRLPLTFWAAVIFVLAAAATSVAWYFTPKLDSLAPNIITELLSIAITVSAVEWILRRQAQERLRPRTEDVLYWMGLDFRMFTGSVLLDYASTHIDTFKQLPRDASELIELWIAEHDREDEPRWKAQGAWLPGIVMSALDFEKGLGHARQRDLDVLEPDLVRAIDNLHWHIHQAIQLLGFVEQGLNDREGTEPAAMSTLMRGVQEFAQVFRRYGKQWFEILDININGTLAHREHIVRKRREADSRP
jgi:hypothetical protein